MVADLEHQRIALLRIPIGVGEMFKCDSIAVLFH